MFVQGRGDKSAYVPDSSAITNRIEFHRVASVGFDADQGIAITSLVTSHVVAGRLQAVHRPEDNLLAGIGGPDPWATRVGWGIQSTAHGDWHDCREKN